MTKKYHKIISSKAILNISLGLLLSGISLAFFFYYPYFSLNRITDHGVTIYYPRNLEYQIVPSSGNNYSNYTFKLKGQNTISNIVVSVSIGPTSGDYSNIKDFFGLIDSNSVTTSKLDGKTGQSATFTTKPSPGDVFIPGKYYYEIYPSQIKTSPLSLTFFQVQNEPSLATNYQLMKKYLRWSETKVSSSKQKSIAFSSLCDCYLVAGENSPSIVYDTTTGKEVNFPLVPRPDSQGDFYVPNIATSGHAITAVIGQSKNLEYRKLIESVTQTVYSTDNSHSIGTNIWSPDEGFVVASILAASNSADGTPMTTSIVSINLTDGKVSEIVTEKQLHDLGLTTMFPILASAQATKVLLESGDMSSQQVWVWTAKDGLRKIDTSFVRGVYSATTTVGGNQEYLTLGQDGLQVFDLTTETSKAYPVKTWSDSPISDPSPDGHYVVYLKANAKNSGGTPTRLDLQSGDELQLSISQVGDQASMLRSFWTPDGDYIAFSTDYLSSNGYSVLKTSFSGQTINKLTLPLDSDKQWIFRAITKGSADSVNSMYVSVLDDLGEPHASISTTRKLDPQIENWNLYKQRADYSLTSGCSNNYKSSIFKLDTSRKVQILNSFFPLVETQNLDNWTLEEAKAEAEKFAGQDCGVGTPFPIFTTPDRIIWVNRCLGGVMPAKSDPGYQSEISCLNTEEIVAKHFSLEPWE